MLGQKYNVCVFWQIYLWKAEWTPLPETSREEKLVWNSHCYKTAGQNSPLSPIISNLNRWSYSLAITECLNFPLKSHKPTVNFAELSQPEILAEYDAPAPKSLLLYFRHHVDLTLTVDLSLFLADFVATTGWSCWQEGCLGMLDVCAKEEPEVSSPQPCKGG